MEMEKPKTPRKRLWLKIMAVTAGLWVLLMGVDFVRFAASDSYITPIINVEHNYSHSCEWREECGILYSFDYTFDSELHLQNKTPDSADFRIFGITIYSKDIEDYK